MLKLLSVASLILSLVALRDVWERIDQDVPKILWTVMVLVPLLGPAFWYYVQYAAPRARALERSRRAPRPPRRIDP